MSQEPRTELGKTISGYEDIVRGFGEWPSFHDAEVIELFLTRQGESWICLDPCRGMNGPAGNTLIKSSFDEVLDLELCDFSHQNVISALRIERSRLGFRLYLDPCFGIQGWLEVKSIRVEMIDQASG